MPPYLNVPGQKVRALMPGTPEYLLGSWNQDVATTKMWVSKVALTSDVATLTVQVVRGAIPAVGSAVTVRYTKTGAGEFNVTRIPLTDVSIDASTGLGTVSFALVESDVVAVTDGGEALVDTPEVPETLAEGASAPAYFLQDFLGAPRGLSALVSFPEVPTDAVVTLQQAMTNQDSEYHDLGTVATVAGSSVTLGTLDYTIGSSGFYRFNVSSVTGSGTIVAKLAI